MRDGDMVRYSGLDPAMGEAEGMVLSASGEACHVKWSSGAHAGEITMIMTEDLQQVKSPVQVARESSLFFNWEDEAPAAEPVDPGLVEGHLVLAHDRMSALAGEVREHVVNLVLQDSLLVQAMDEIGEETMVSMVLSEANHEQS